MDALFGSLQLGLNGVPFFTSSCNQTTCWGTTASGASVMYHFQRWLVARAISLAVINLGEPSVSLKIPRVREYDAEIFVAARDDNIERLKRILQDGQGSPNDIQGKFGRSLLHVSVQTSLIDLIY